MLCDHDRDEYMCPYCKDEEIAALREEVDQLTNALNLQSTELQKALAFIDDAFVAHPNLDVDMEFIRKKT